MDSAQSKASRLKRKRAQPIQLTERDIEIMRALHRYRFLTTDHLQTLTQTESRWGMNKRLRVLYDHKYIDRPKAQAAIYSHAQKRPTVYALGNAGASLLSQRFDLDMPKSGYWTEKNRRVRERHIEHTLGISEFMVGIEDQCRAKDGLHFMDQADILVRSPAMTRQTKYPFRWKTRVSYGGVLHEIMILPDYVFGLREASGRERFYFVEIDRGTMPVSRRDIRQTSFMRKVLSYEDTFQRQLAKTRFGIRGFQVLTVTSSDQRIETICEAIRSERGITTSANTFLFSAKPAEQGRLSGMSEWRNVKGQSADII